jgi:hypothetical protein
LSRATPTEYTINVGDTIEFLPGGVFVTHYGSDERVQLMKTDHTINEIRRCCKWGAYA